MNLETKELEERSDYLEYTQVQDWYVDSAYFQTIQKKLKGTGAKLLVGPRGTGKTHQMLLAHMECIRDKTKPVSLYVSFNRYYHLEPLMSSAPNAKKIFHTWVLAKIVLAIHEFLEKAGIVLNDFLIEDFLGKIYLENFIGQAEKGLFRFDDEEVLYKLSVSSLKNIIESCVMNCKRKRAILLLDDAALTLTPEYLVEFFEIFVSLKSMIIAPKASVYPGTTEYGMKFHLGQDAEKVECWMNVSEDMNAYSSFMDTLIEKRFSSITQSIDKEIVEILKYASFGIPRAFIFLIRSYIQSNKSTKQAKFNEVIDQHSTLIKAEYLSLKRKVPQFSNIIEVGSVFFENIINAITESNKSISNQKNLVLGIEVYDNKMVDRMIQFLNEAGLLYRHSSNVSHGQDREYIRFNPHIIFLIKANAFSYGKGFDSTKILEKLLAPEKKHPLRRKYQTLLMAEEIEKLKLNLPPCPKCQTIRFEDNQRFCHNCGAELIMPSSFESCMNLDINTIPLTPLQKTAVEQAKFKKIRDFYSIQNPRSELTKVNKIGGKRSQSIIDKVISIVDEFLT
ncbi:MULTISPECIES: zinc ribbon domain-containing protein [Sphingobacterium]|uniref:zinc ribbon domain-containing protein n=1 Tax=Sphingobacterium TaxID=28453 RepID=UPI0013DA3A5D|nr:MULTISPECIES: zinc ribbon domain-containing protein [unclassified Sphingobacterium]